MHQFGSLYLPLSPYCVASKEITTTTRTPAESLRNLGKVSNFEQSHDGGDHYPATRSYRAASTWYPPRKADNHLWGQAWVSACELGDVRLSRLPQFPVFSHVTSVVRGKNATNRARALPAVP